MKLLQIVCKNLVCCTLFSNVRKQKSVAQTVDGHSGGQGPCRFKNSVDDKSSLYYSVVECRVVPSGVPYSSRAIRLFL